MLYIYDILVNFMDGNRIYEFFEWDYKDIIEHIRKIPAIRVDQKTFRDLLNYEVRVDQEFLRLIKDKTYTYKEGIEYALIISNLERCYALEFNSRGEIIYKSSLLIDEEDDIIECSRKLDEFKIGYTLVKQHTLDKDYFTRREEVDRNLLKREIISTYENKDYEKLVYLYEEAYGRDNSDIDEKYKKLINDIDEVFSINLKKIVQIIRLTNKKRKAI